MLQIIKELTFVDYIMLCIAVSIIITFGVQIHKAYITHQEYKQQLAKHKHAKKVNKSNSTKA